MNTTYATTTHHDRRAEIYPATPHAWTGRAFDSIEDAARSADHDHDRLLAIESGFVVAVCDNRPLDFATWNPIDHEAETRRALAR